MITTSSAHHQPYNHDGDRTFHCWAETATTTDMTSIYTVSPSPEKGLGCFSTALIPAGTLILSETPLFNVREPRTNAAVLAAFLNLTISEQEYYLTLYAQTATARDAKVIDIFNSNAWQTGSRTSICPQAARFNHSCVPNASFAWNARLRNVTVYAIVAIPANTEIFLSYERPYQTGYARREKLSAYGFACSCIACGVGAEASDIRRARMAVLDARIRSQRRQLWRTEMPKAEVELVRLLKEEGIMGEALGLAHHDAAAGWRKYGRVDLAVRYAAKELGICMVCFGPDSPCVDTTRAFLLELKSQLAKELALVSEAP